MACEIGSIVKCNEWNWNISARGTYSKLRVRIERNAFAPRRSAAGSSVSEKSRSSFSTFSNSFLLPFNVLQVECRAMEIKSRETTLGTQRAALNFKTGRRYEMGHQTTLTLSLYRSLDMPRGPHHFITDSQKLILTWGWRCDSQKLTHPIEVAAVSPSPRLHIPERNGGCRHRFASLFCFPSSSSVFSLPLSLRKSAPLSKGVQLCNLGS